MRLIGLRMGLTLGALALAACANDKPANDASQTTTTSAATNESPNQPLGSSSGVATTNTKGSNGDDAAHSQTWGGPVGSTPAPGSNGNAAGASQPAPQPGVTAPPPPQNQNGGSALTPMDQGNNPGDLKITQQIRKQVVSDSALSFTAKNVKIITVNGRVTLRGEVNSDNEKKSIEATADKVVGNSNVDNQITIKQ
ncbi:MAG: BON domain-containing protein [Polyangiaceae bacterium]